MEVYLKKAYAGQLCGINYFVINAQLANNINKPSKNEVVARKQNLKPEIKADV